MFEVKGTIKLINDEETFGSGFTKREFVLVSDDDRYPQDLKFEMVKESCSKLDAFNPGDRVNVSFNLRGREWKESYFVNLNAWRIEALPGEGSSAPPARQPEMAGSPANAPAPAQPSLPGHTTTQHDEVPF